MNVNSRPLVIGISGGSGSGKTSILNAFVNQMPKGSVAVVTQDNYYKSIEHQPLDANGQYNFDMPESIDHSRLVSDLLSLQNNKSVQMLEYNFNNDLAEERMITVHPAPIILTEGLFVFHLQEINNLLDYRVFIEVDEEIRLNRRIERDYQERGYTKEVVMYQWENHVKLADESFLFPYKSACDLIIENNEEFHRGVGQMVEAVLKKKPDLL